MKYFQLFCDKPTEDFMIILLQCYGLNGLSDIKEFSKGDLIENNTVSKIEDLIPELVLYYLPCKSIVYLNRINEKRCITILSQFLKLFNYKLGRKERVVNKKKLIYYHIIHNDNFAFHVHNNTCNLDFE